MFREQGLKAQVAPERVTDRIQPQLLAVLHLVRRFSLPELAWEESASKPARAWILFLPGPCNV